MIDKKYLYLFAVAYSILIAFLWHELSVRDQELIKTKQELTEQKHRLDSCLKAR